MRIDYPTQNGLKTRATSEMKTALDTRFVPIRLPNAAKTETISFFPSDPLFSTRAQDRSQQLGLAFSATVSIASHFELDIVRQQSVFQMSLYSGLVIARMAIGDCLLEIE
jgi:hypothetical protein